MESVKFSTARRGVSIEVVYADRRLSVRIALSASGRVLAALPVSNADDATRAVKRVLSIIDGFTAAPANPEGRPSYLPAGPIVVSFGLGIDSMAVLVGLHQRGIRPDVIVFADTGSEKRATYDYLPIVESWLAAVGFPALTRLETRTREGHLLSLEQHAFRTRRLPAFAYGGASCSLKFKGNKIDAHVMRLPIVREALARGEKIIRVVGYDDSKADRKRAENTTKTRTKLLSEEAQEELREMRAAADRKRTAKARTEAHREVRARAAKIEWAKRDARQNYWWYALQHWRWVRADCIRHIEAAGIHAPPKSACYFCPANRPFELVEILLDEPERAYRIVLMETLAMPSHKKDVGLWRSETKGTRKGKGGTTVLTKATPKPLYMGTYLLEWLRSGRAFDRWMPELDRKGTALETAAMEHVGALYNGGRLRVLQHTEPDPAAMVALREKARVASEALRARCDAAGILVDGRLVRFSDSDAAKDRAADAAWAEVLRMDPSEIVRKPVKRPAPRSVEPTDEDEDDDEDPEGETFMGAVCDTATEESDDLGPDYGGGVSVIVPTCDALTIAGE